MEYAKKAIVFDFDGTISDSFPVIQEAFDRLGLDLCELDTFRDRAKFLKYLGKKKKWKTLWRYMTDVVTIRQTLKNVYEEKGKLFNGFSEMIRDLIKNPEWAVYILSRNYSLDPEKTIRKVLIHSGIKDQEKIQVRTLHPRKEKHLLLRKILEETKLSVEDMIVTGDEYTDYKAFLEEGFPHRLIATYGFDSAKKLRKKKGIPKKYLVDTPEDLQKRVREFL